MHVTERVLLAITVAVAACRGRHEIEYVRLTLPGFSLELPNVGRAPSWEHLSYRGGDIVIGEAALNAGVSWRVGQPATTKDMPREIATWVNAGPSPAQIGFRDARALVVAGHQATELPLTLNGITATFVEIECGTRSVLIGLTAGDRLDEIRQHVLDSFQCHPDATEERTIATTPPFAIDDPALLAGWWRTRDERMFAITDGKRTLKVVEAATEVIDETTFVTLVPALFKDVIGRDTWVGEATEERIIAGERRMFQRGTARLHGDNIGVGVLSMSPCRGRRGALVALAIVHDASELDGATELLGHVHCARPGDPPLSLRAEPE